MPNPLPESLIKINPTMADGGVTSDESQKNYYDYEYAKGVYSKLIGAWAEITGETERQRDLRYIKDADSIQLRAQGIIKPDELYTPTRLIDTNIRTEQPSYVQYLTQSRRSIIFATTGTTTVDGLDKLEETFTKVARYEEWEVPFIRTIDGTEAFGWDAVEIIFDPDKPGNFCFEHIGHSRLIFNTDSEDIESQEVIAIEKNLTSKQLLNYVTKDGWDKSQVDKLISSNARALGISDCVNKVYEVFFKQDGIVHVAWYAVACDSYLKAPEPLFMGVRDITAPKQPAVIDPATQQETSPEDYPPVFETEYPVILEKYIESEDPKIVELSGRVRLDEASQEAASALQSSIVNGSIRASNVMGSPETTPLDSQPSDLPILTDVVIGNGRLMSRPVRFFNTPWPPADAVQFLQAVVQSNKQEQSKVDFAALNRKDSGKTATEIQAATNKSTELSSVQIILLSIFIRKCYAKAWRIYQSRVLQGKIIIKDPTILQLFGENIQVGEDMAVFACSKPSYYIIKSSGDVDVIQRAEKLQKLMQGWEVFGKTPIASEYLKDILRLAFPDDAARYIAILDQAQMDQVNMLKQLLAKTGMVLQASVTGQLNPAQHQGELIQLAQQIQGAINQPDINGQGGQMSDQQPQQAA